VAAANKERKTKWMHYRLHCPDGSRAYAVSIPAGYHYTVTMRSGYVHCFRDRTRAEVWFVTYPTAVEFKDWLSGTEKRKSHGSSFSPCA